MDLQTAVNSPAFPYNDNQWAARRQFVDQVNAICERETISVEWFSHFWIARLSHGPVHKYLVGYAFPVNTADAVAIARDKVAAYEVLAGAGIPAVPHWALHFPPHPFAKTTLAQIANYALELHPLPLVVKPIAGSTGLDVYRAQTLTELLGQLTILSSHHHTAAVSPLVSDAEEYRVIMLKSEPQIVFRKVRPQARSGQSEWRHNLALGSMPEPVTDRSLVRMLAGLAAQTMQELGLTLAAVDIIESSAGLQVIEVNTGFTMHHLSKDPRFFDSVNALISTAIKLSVI